MTSMRDREAGFESKFAHDEAMEFKAQARRDKAVAEWIGPQLGLSGEALADYVTAVWRADLKSPGDQDVFDKVMADVTAHGAPVTGAELRAKMDALLAQARRELQEGA